MALSAQSIVSKWKFNLSLNVVALFPCNVFFFFYSCKCVKLRTIFFFSMSKRLPILQEIRKGRSKSELLFHTVLQVCWISVQCTVLIYFVQWGSQESTKVMRAVFKSKYNLIFIPRIYSRKCLLRDWQKIEVEKSHESQLIIIKCFFFFNHLTSLIRMYHIRILWWHRNLWWWLRPVTF